MGGLGNQLFQIFAVLSYALRHKQSFLFQNCKTLLHGTHRPTYWDTLLKNLKPFLRDKSLLQCGVYQEQGFDYTELPEGLDNHKLLGYFQSWKYFQDQKDTILALLGLPTQIAEVREKYPQYFAVDGTPVVIHFRIKNYKEIQDFHPLCTKEYYRAAVQHIKQHVQNPYFLVFQQPEDSEEVQSMLHDILHTGDKSITISSEIPDYKQMLLMANCKAHIIANSTFSWWGAYLAQSETVCYPDTWFGPKAGHGAEDLPLPQWQRISCVLVSDQAQVGAT